jgi:ABC-type uncharacterized transport system substrate-binding protein
MEKTRFLMTALILALVMSVFGAKILYINSYHDGFAWSDEIGKAITTTIGDAHELRTEYMDTKRHPDEEFKISAGERMRDVINEWKPDVVIVSDDNAAKYVIVPFFMDAELPFVFCGVNWDASDYGFPTKNVTGMIEISNIEGLLGALKEHTQGERIGFLTADNFTEHKDIDVYKTRFDISLDDVYVSTFADWKKEFLALQERVDVIVLGPNAAIEGWSDEKAHEFFVKETKLPTGSFYDFMQQFVLLSYLKLEQEQGEWAAQTAMQILDGKSPSEIPIVENEKTMVVYNREIAEKLGIDLPDEPFKPMILE